MLPNYQARSLFVLKHTTSLYICVDVRMSFCTLTLPYFCVATLSQISLNRIFWFIDHYLCHPRN